MEHIDEWQHNVYGDVGFREATSVQPGHEGERVIQVHDLNTGEVYLEASAHDGITLLNQNAPPGQCTDQLIMTVQRRGCWTYNPCACWHSTLVFNCGGNTQPCNNVNNTYDC